MSVEKKDYATAYLKSRITSMLLEALRPNFKDFNGSIFINQTDIYYLVREVIVTNIEFRSSSKLQVLKEYLLELNKGQLDQLDFTLIANSISWNNSKNKNLLRYTFEECDFILTNALLTSEINPNISHRFEENHIAEQQIIYLMLVMMLQSKLYTLLLVGEAMITMTANKTASNGYNKFCKDIGWHSAY